MRNPFAEQTTKPLSPAGLALCKVRTLPCVRRPSPRRPGGDQVPVGLWRNDNSCIAGDMVVME